VVIRWSVQLTDHSSASRPVQQTQLAVRSSFILRYTFLAGSRFARQICRQIVTESTRRQDERVEDVRELSVQLQHDVHQIHQGRSHTGCKMNA